MLDVLTMVSQLNRPVILVQTARHGVQDYTRNVHLKRTLKTETLPRPADALMRLMQIEAELDDQRHVNRATYSFATHIDVLIAIMAEARLLRGLRQSKARAEQIS